MRDEKKYLDRDGVIRILNRMNEIGMRRVDLARSLGYANGSYISRLESGTLFISLKKLDKWASALQTTPEYLLGKTDDPNDLDYIDIQDETVHRILTYYKNMNEREVKLWISIGQDILNARKTHTPRAKKKGK